MLDYTVYEVIKNKKYQRYVGDAKDMVFVNNLRSKNKNNKFSGKANK